MTFRSRDTVTLRDRFKMFTDHKEVLQTELHNYITAPHFTLEQRWQMFLDAPRELSKNDEFIYHGLDWFKAGGEEDYDTWIRAMDYEKGEIISLPGLVAYILSGEAQERLKYPPCMEEDGFLDKIKEQILKDNIKSFVHAW